MGSIRAIRVAGGANSFICFSLGLGGGVKVYFTRHLGLRIQAEWLAKSQQRFCHQRYLHDLEGVRLKDATWEWGRLSLTVASTAPLD